MASADEVYLTIRGEGGHAAAPHALRADAVLVQAHVLTALQSVISRNSPPDVPSVLSFGKIVAEGATNVIPEDGPHRGHIPGDGRGLALPRARPHPPHRRADRRRVRRDVRGRDRRRLPGARERPATSRRPCAQRPWSTSATSASSTFRRWFASEDFAFYTQRMPGAFYVLGVGNEAEGITHGLHTPRFTIDEEALRTGPGFMAYLAWRRGADSAA